MYEPYVKNRRTYAVKELVSSSSVVVHEKISGENQRTHPQWGQNDVSGLEVSD